MPKKPSSNANALTEPEQLQARLALLRQAEDHPSLRKFCEEFKISRPTLMRWKRRYEAEGEWGLLDRSRRPKSHPRQTPAGTVQALLDLARLEPDLGCMALAKVLHSAEDPLGGFSGHF